MTELETQLLAALERQGEALNALQMRVQTQQTQIDQLANLVENYNHSTEKLMMSYSRVERSLKELVSK